MTNPALQQALSKIRWRILPFVALMFAMAIIDRSNIGFAKHAFQADTGLSNAAFALGAGIFFIGYAVFEVPSNLMLHRFGARRWIALIMVIWGLLSTSLLFVRTAEATGPALTVEAFARTLEGMEFSRDYFGSPNYRFTPEDHLGNRHGRLAQIRNGRWELITDYLQ